MCVSPWHLSTTCSSVAGILILTTDAACEWHLPNNANAIKMILNTHQLCLDVGEALVGDFFPLIYKPGKWLTTPWTCYVVVCGFSQVHLYLGSWTGVRWSLWSIHRAMYCDVDCIHLGGVFFPYSHIGAKFVLYKRQYSIRCRWSLWQWGTALKKKIIQYILLNMPTI